MLVRTEMEIVKSNKDKRIYLKIKKDRRGNMIMNMNMNMSMSMIIQDIIK